MKSLLKIIYPLLSVALFAFGYYLLSLRLDSKIAAPQIDLIVKETGKIIAEKTFAKTVFSTLWRAVYGFMISLLIATVFAVIASAGEIIEKLLYPLTLISRAIPTMSIILLCLIWLKADKTPVAVSVVIVFPMLYSLLLSAIKSVNDDMKDVIRVYRVPKFKALVKYYIPSVFILAFPQLVTTLSFNIKLTISGEALAYTPGSIGVQMKLANGNFNTANLLAWTIVSVLLGFAVELILKALYKIGERVRYGYRNRKFN